MESPKLTFSPGTKKIIIKIYDNPTVENGNKICFTLPAPERVITIIPVELPENTITVSIGVEEATGQ